MKEKTLGQNLTYFVLKIMLHSLCGLFLFSFTLNHILYYLHQIISLCTPPHSPSPAACPGNDEQRLHNRQPHPSLASARDREREVAAQPTDEM